MRRALFILVAIFACAQAFSSPQASTIPDTPSGTLLKDYIQAFNSGEDQMRGFFAKHISKEDLERAPVETRVSRFRQMKERLGTLKLVKVVDSTATSVRAQFDTADGRSEFTFELAPTNPPTLRGIRIEDLEGPDGDGIPTSPQEE